jgi:hypothetical protein
MRKWAAWRKYIMEWAPGKNEGRQREERGKGKWERGMKGLFPLSLPFVFPLSSLFFPWVNMNLNPWLTKQ